MSHIAIEVCHVWKKFRRGEIHNSLRDLLPALARSVVGHGAESNLLVNGDFWALSDVNFQVGCGEAIGIIGPNGAGKSTMLKLLCRILKPTSGNIKVNGRVGALIEVGAGFHPDLTGRENVYLNGAILGMKKDEILKKFDEIVEFSGLEEFIDTPVKRYSSGMYARLAFAVSAHVDPEILLVDEVLSVGDAAFQKRSLGKMEDVTRQGCTVLFVSHNLGAIKSLCTRAILLDAGRVAVAGTVDEVVSTYLMPRTAGTGIIPDDAPRLCSTGEAKLRSVQLLDDSGRSVSRLFFVQPFRIVLTVEILRELREVVIEIGIIALDGTHVTYSSTMDGGSVPLYLAKGGHTITFETDVVLMPRQYTLFVAIHHFNGTTIESIERALDFTVSNVARNGPDNYRWGSNVRGYVRAAARWHVREVFSDPARRTHSEVQL